MIVRVMLFNPSNFLILVLNHLLLKDHLPAFSIYETVAQRKAIEYTGLLAVVN